jgi:predicted dehydrogenase/threonine dehydrogenase-like Zn-dependent dehydrogenase
MKQLLIRKGQVEIVEVAAPPIRPGMVLIRTLASCISAGTELATIESSGETLLDKARRKPELIKRGLDMLVTQGFTRTLDSVRGKLDAGSPSGYSLCGMLIEVGEGVEDLKVGMRVAAAGAAYANHAEVVSVPRNLVVPVPDGISDQDAASVTLGAIAMQGVRRANPSLGESAAVIGLGLLGQITIQILNANGVRAVGFDLDPARVSQAKQNGCRSAFVSDQVNAVDEAMNCSGGHGVDFVIITAATRSNDPLNEALDMCRKKGRVVIVGDVGLLIDRNKVYPKEIDVLISTSYGPGRYDHAYEEEGQDYPLGYVRWTENRNMVEFLRLIAEKKLSVSPLINATFPLERAAEAYQALSGEDRPLLVVLTYPDKPGASLLDRSIVHAVDPSPRKSGVLNVGVIGAGNFATAVHLPNLLAMSDRFRIHTICDIHGPTALQAATRFNALRYSSDAESVCRNEEIDVVIICTRHDQHAPIASLAAENGKAVLCEKPMGMSRDEVLALARIIKEKEAPYLVGFNRRFSPAAREIRKRIIDRNYPLVIAYIVNAGYLPEDHWTHGPEGGGRIVGEGCHMIDLCAFLTGSSLVDIKAKSINPGGHKYFSRDNIGMNLAYEDGSIAHIIYTAMGAKEFPKERVEVHAGGWTYVIDDFKKLSIFGPKLETKEWKTAEKGHAEELLAFSEWLRGKTEPPISLPSLVETSLATFAVYEQI